MTRTDDLRRLLTVALAADEPASANAIRRTLATWEQEDAARRGLDQIVAESDWSTWDAARRATVPWTQLYSRSAHDSDLDHLTPARDHEAAVLGASALACLGLAQSCDDLVQHVSDPRPPTAD